MLKEILAGVAVSTFALTATAFADGHGMHKGVKASDQDVSGGTVMAETIMADANGWMVVHRTDSSMKPGPVVGHAPLMKGENEQVVAILTEPVKSGEMLMLMLHGEGGGTKTGIFEYSLGAKEDGPIKVDGKLVMKTITAQ